MKIIRDSYLNQLIAGKHNGLVKVVTGIRRCGKSYLLMNLFRDHLKKSGVVDSHIISIDLDDLANESLREKHALYNHVGSLITDGDMYYILLDEIQWVTGFEDVLNGFLHMNNADVYVTGSNSKFLSSDIITEFRGRGDEIHVHPLSFAEFYSVYAGTEEQAWKEYYTYGGMPLILSMKTEDKKAKYLKSLFDETYAKDMIEHNHIRNITGLDEVINILASSIGSATNPERIKNTFKSTQKVDVSAPTIQNYIKYLKEAFIIEEAQRYDVKSLKYIGANSKYYYTDIGLRNAKLNFRQQEESHIMENIVYNELRIRGYNVDVGIVEVNVVEDGKKVKRGYEVDFVANKGSQRYYLQSALSIPDRAKEAQEMRSLNHIDDSFKKMVIVKDNIMLKRDEKGIVTMGILQFLLDPESLNI
ncbi:MAG: ATP-binding protein [Sphaerochaetaceae bacterium]